MGIHLLVQSLHLTSKLRNLLLYTVQRVSHHFPLHLGQLLSTVLNVVDGALGESRHERRVLTLHSHEKILVSRQIRTMHVKHLKGLALHVQLSLQLSLQSWK